MTARKQPRRTRAARRRSGGGARAALRLGPLLTIREVAPARDALDALLASGAAHADASALESIDTAGLQLLLVAGRAARQRGLRLRVRGGERVLREAADALGLATQLSEAVELTL